MLVFLTLNSSPPLLDGLFLSNSAHLQLICFLHLLLTHLIFGFFHTLLPHLLINPLSPIRIIPSLSVPLCPLSQYFLFSCLFALSLLPSLPPFSFSLPAMQTLKVNLHSKVLLLASATVTERFSSMPPLFCFLFSFPFNV